MSQGIANILGNGFFHLYQFGWLSFFTFYFGIIIDLEETAEIVQRTPGTYHPPPTVMTFYITIEHYQN